MSVVHTRRPVGLRRLLVGAFVLAASLGVALAVLAVWQDHEQTRRHAEQQLRSAAALVEAHATGILLSADQMVRRTMQFIGGRDLATMREDRGDWAELKAMADSLPYVSSILVVDRDGFTALSSVAFPSRRIDVRDRDYFKAHAAAKAAEEDDLFIGATIIARRSQRAVFTVSRRLEAPDGSFAGLVAVTVDANYFAEAYGKTGLGPSAVLAVGRQDGTLIARQPMPATVAERSLADSPLFRSYLAQSPAGVYRGASVVDGIDRLMAYRAAERLPVVAFASLAMDDVFVRWRVRAAWVAALAAAGLTVAGALFALLLRGLDREVGVRAELEQANVALDASNRRLAATLAEKQVLFREVHHRVTNNLQVVTALLRLQAGRTGDAEARDAFESVLNRVASMALLHRVLYRTDQADRVAFGAYLEELCEQLADAFALDERGIALVVTAEPCALPLDRAVPAALAVNEAITNAIKHAFPEGCRGTIAVRVHRDRDGTVVEVRDDGVGLGGDAGPAGRSGIGRTLLRRLVQQAGGRYTLENGPPDGPPAGRPGTIFRLCLSEDQPDGEDIG
ncbi:sensor histidine kinase [Azospirillum sp. ST 5-10]|uniref:sensor histidine kinase n=1 Tax=unclassified Azospirillum TaxID=2630922 RepID=UPI003F49C8AA